MTNISIPTPIPIPEFPAEYTLWKAFFYTPLGVIFSISIILFIVIEIYFWKTSP